MITFFSKDGNSYLKVGSTQSVLQKIYQNKIWITFDGVFSSKAAECRLVILEMDYSITCVFLEMLRNFPEQLHWTDVSAKKT